MRILIELIRNAVKLLAKTNSKLPGILEFDLKQMQGKGAGGASSVEIEAKIAIDFLTKRGIENPVVLDIGANVGRYSAAILGSNPYARIFAFEPSSAAREELQKRFRGSKEITIIPLALSNSKSTQTLWSDTAGSGLASLTRRRLDHFKIKFDHSEQVEVNSLDNWLKESLIIPDLIKMDVEGHELDVLMGGTEALKMVQVVQFEFGGCNIDTRTYFQDFWYFFSQLGFELYRISESGPIRVTQYSEEDEYFKTTNYLATRG